MSRCLPAFLLAGLLFIPRTSAAPVQTPEARKDALGDPLPPHTLLRVGTVRFRHGDAVTALAVSADGKMVASAGRDDFVRVWDLATGKEQLHWRQDDDSGSTIDVYALALSHDGKRLVTASTSPGKTTVWDPATGRPLRSFQKSGGPHPFLGFLADGDTLLLRHDRTVQLVRSATGEECRTFALDNREGADDLRRLGRRRDRDDLECFALSPDGSLMLTGQSNGAVRVWDVAKGMELRRIDGDAERISALALSLDNQLYAWANTRGQLNIGKVNGDNLHQLTPDGNCWIDALAFSPDCKQLACGGGGGVVSVIATDTGKEIWRMDAHDDGVTCLAYTSDGQSIVSGGYDSCLRVWDAQTGKEKTPVYGTRGRIFLALSPDGNRVATLGPNQPVHVWDAHTGNKVQSLPLGTSLAWGSLIFSQDGSRLSALTDKTLRSWDLETGRELRRLHVGRKLQQGVLSPDGRMVVGRTDTSKLYLFGVLAQRSVSLPKKSDTLFRYTISPDSQWVGTLGNAGDIHLWEAATGKEFSRFKVPARVFNLAFTPDKKLLITLSTRTQGEQ